MNLRRRNSLAAALAVLMAGGSAAAFGAPVVAVLGFAAFAAAIASARVWSQPVKPARASVAVPTSPSSDQELELLDALPLAVVVIAAEGTIRTMNTRAAEIFGLRGSRHPAAALRAPRLLGLIEAALQDSAPGTVDFTLPRAGDRQLRAHVRPAGDGGAVVAVEDRTDAVRAAELHRDFVANASHELKTPLAAVSATIETLLGHARDDPAATERFLGLMADQIRRMIRLVEDLLSLNRVELNARVTPREPQDLVAAVAAAVEALRPIAERMGVRLTFDAPQDAPRVFGDRNELDQVFRNLVENAIRYGGSAVDVQVGISRPVGTPGMIGVRIRDDGPGIAREHLPRLTERFYRVSDRRSREKGGTGLGLAIVKHAVVRHRGKLEIESMPGEGSCFTVWLPSADPATATASKDGES